MSSWDDGADDGAHDEEHVETPSCPLCMEELDLTDLSFHPCKCGYQICLWCYQQLSDAVDAKCPACRSPFVQLAGGSVVAPQSVLAAAHAHAALAQNAARLAGKKKSANANKERQTAIPSAGPSRDMSGQLVPIEGAGLTPLSEVRVVQRNLAYIVGLSSACGREDLLRKKEWLGIGKTQKVAVAKSFGSGSGPQANVPTFAAYVTYRDRADAAEAIKMVNFGPLGLMLAKGGQGAGGTGDGEPPRARASFGTTKYCAAWLKGSACIKSNCLYLHAMASLADCCTKDQLQRDRFDERFGLGKKNLAAQAAAAASSSSSSVPASLPQPEMMRSASTPASFGSSAGSSVAQPRPLSFATMVAQQSAAAAAAHGGSGGGSNHVGQSSSTEPAHSPPPTAEDFPPLGGSPSLAQQHKNEVSPAKSPAPQFVSQIPAPAPIETEQPEEAEEEQEEPEEAEEEQPEEEQQEEEQAQQEQEEQEPELPRAETPEPPEPTPQQTEADQKALQLLFSRPAHPISSLQPSPPATPSAVTLSSAMPSASPIGAAAKPIRPPPGFRDIGAKPLSSPPGFGAPPPGLGMMSALPLQNAPVVHSFTAAALPSAAPSNLFASAAGSSTSGLPMSHVASFASATLTDPNADSWEQRWDVSGAGSSVVNGLGSNGHLRDSQQQQQSDHQLPWLQSSLQQMSFGEQQHRQQQLNGLGVGRQQEQSAAQAYQLSARAALIQAQGQQNALPRGLVNMIPAPSDSPQQQQQQAPSQPQWQPQTMAPRFQSMHAPLQVHQQMVALQRQQEEQQRQQQQQQQQQQHMGQSFQQQQHPSRHTPPLASGSSTPQDSPMKSQQGGSRYRFAEEGQSSQQQQPQSHLFQRNLFESAGGRFEDHSRQQQQQWEPQQQQQQQHLHSDYQQVQSRYAQPVSPPRANQAGHFGSQGLQQQFGGPQQQMQYGAPQQQDRELDFLRMQAQQQQREQQHQQQQQLPPHQQLHQSLSQQALPVSHYAPSPSLPHQPPFGHGAPPGGGSGSGGSLPPHPAGPMRHPRPPMSSNSSHSSLNLKGKARPHDSNEGEQREAQQENNYNISNDAEWMDTSFVGGIGQQQQHSHHHLLFRPDSPDEDDHLLIHRAALFSHSAHIGDSTPQPNTNFTPFSNGGSMQMAHALHSVAVTEPLSSSFNHLSPSSRRASDSLASDPVVATSSTAVAPPAEEPATVIEPLKAPPQSEPVVSTKRPATVAAAVAAVAPPTAAPKPVAAAPKPSPAKKPNTVSSTPAKAVAPVPVSVKAPVGAAAKPPTVAVAAAAVPVARPAVQAASKASAPVPLAAAIVSASAPVTPQRKGRATAAAATPTPRPSPGAPSQAKVVAAAASPAPAPKPTAKTVAASAVVLEKTAPAAAAVRAAPVALATSPVVVAASKAAEAVPASPSKPATRNKENTPAVEKVAVPAPAPVAVAAVIPAPQQQKKAGGKKGRRGPVPQNRPATPPPPKAPAPVVAEPAAEEAVPVVPAPAVIPTASPSKPAKKKAQKQSKASQQQQQQQSKSNAAAKSSSAATRGGGYVLSTTSVPVAPDAPIFLSDSVSPAALVSAMASHALPYPAATATLGDRSLAHRPLGSSPLPLSVDDFAEVHRELLGLARLVRAGSLPPLELQAVLSNLVEAQVPNLPSWEKLLAMEELASDEEGGSTDGSKIEQQVALQVEKQLEEHVAASAAAAEKSNAAPETAVTAADVVSPTVANFTYPSLLALRFDSTLSLHYDERYRAWEQSSSFSRDLCKEVYVLSQTLSAQKRRLRESKRMFEAAREELEDMLLGGAGGSNGNDSAADDAEHEQGEVPDDSTTAERDSASPHSHGLHSDDDDELRDLHEASAAASAASSAGSSSRSHHDRDASQAHHRLVSSSSRSTVVCSSISPPSSEGTNSNSSTLTAGLVLSPADEMHERFHRSSSEVDAIASPASNAVEAD